MTPTFRKIFLTRVVSVEGMPLFKPGISYFVVGESDQYLWIKDDNIRAQVAKSICLPDAAEFHGFRGISCDAS